MTRESVSGRAARITAGRGAGRIVLILREEEGRLLVADGRRIRAEKPKAKNQRHLVLLPYRAEEAFAASNRRLRELIREAEEGIMDRRDYSAKG